MLINKISSQFVTAAGGTLLFLLASLTNPAQAVAQLSDLPPFGNEESFEEFNATLLEDGQLGAGQEEDGIEYLTRGQLHEAFADPYSPEPIPSPVVAAVPPQPIEELPPDLKPEGDSVTWIPGYWAWDDDRNDFVWISGLWRDIPPGQRWLPGYWEQLDEGGHRWINGLWVANEVEQVTYLPAPPESLEVGPSSPAPRDDAFYVPGNWVYQTQGYQWTPGYWTQTQPDWIWVPAAYVWTPRGCIYRAGFWDYEINQRAVMFTPVYFQPHIYSRPRFAYRPRYVVNTGFNLLVHLFVRNNSRHYYFGDYYGNNYRQNFYPWVNCAQRGRGFDPLYTYFSRSTRYRNANYFGNVQQRHQYFAGNSNYRPRHTIAEQQRFLTTNIAGSTNGNFKRGDIDHLRNSVIGQPLESVARQKNASRQFSRLTSAQIEQFAKGSQVPVRDMVERRRKFETSMSTLDRGNLDRTGIDRTGDGVAARQTNGPTGRGNKPNTIAGADSVDNVNPARNPDLKNPLGRSRSGERGAAEPNGERSNLTDRRGGRSRADLDSMPLPDVPSLRDSARRGPVNNSDAQSRVNLRNSNATGTDSTRRRTIDPASDASELRSALKTNGNRQPTINGNRQPNFNRSSDAAAARPEPQLRELQLGQTRAREIERQSAAIRESLNRRSLSPSVNPALDNRNNSDLNRIRPTTPTQPNLRDLQNSLSNPLLNSRPNPSTGGDRQNMRSRSVEPNRGGASGFGGGLATPNLQGRSSGQPMIEPPTVRSGRSLNPGSLNSGSLNPGNLNPGSSSRGSLNPGSLNRGNINPGNLNSGSSGRGSFNPGSLNRGNVNPGNMNRGSFSPPGGASLGGNSRVGNSPRANIGSSPSRGGAGIGAPSTNSGSRVSGGGSNRGGGRGDSDGGGRRKGN